MTSFLPRGKGNGGRYQRIKTFMTWWNMINWLMTNFVSGGRFKSALPYYHIISQKGRSFVGAVCKKLPFVEKICEEHKSFLKWYVLCALFGLVFCFKGQRGDFLKFKFHFCTILVQLNHTIQQSYYVVNYHILEALMSPPNSQTYGFSREIDVH